MRAWAVALIGAVLLAKPPEPEATVRGVLLGWDTGPSGDLSVRVEGNHVYCFRFDAATRVERDGLQAGFMDLMKGDAIEIVTAPGPNPRLRRAAAVLVLSPRPALARATRRSLAPRFSILDELYPRGNLTFAGIVTGVGPRRVVLQTRGQGPTEILLRQDTRFVQDGCEVTGAALRVNSRVFVRGTRNLDGVLEAYQVMWGDILSPH